MKAYQVHKNCECKLRPLHNETFLARTRKTVAQDRSVLPVHKGLSGVSDEVDCEKKPLGDDLESRRSAYSELVVTEEENGLRADKIIRRAGGKISYAFLQKIFRSKKVKVGNRKLRASDKLLAGDVVKIYADLSDVCRNQTEDHDPKLVDLFKEMIIFENDDFLAINKPSGLAVQLGTKVTLCVETLMKAYQVHKNCECKLRSLHNETFLARTRKNVAQDRSVLPVHEDLNNESDEVDCEKKPLGNDLKLVHRIDKDTSGILLIAKNLKPARALTGLFRENKIKKTYIAVVDGKIKKSGIIDNFIEKAMISNEEKMRVSDVGRQAVTKYRPLRQESDQEDFRRYTALELIPSTGRKHQLLVHCSEVLKAPILGDKKYNKNRTHKKLFLHAYKVEIEDLRIIAPIPEYFPRIEIAT
jgi:23S rRNA pseudouridine955/2504/2580 synthase